MLSKRLRIGFRRWHRWAGVMIGVQLLLWVGSGAYFAWMSIDTVKGEDRAKKLELVGLPLGEIVAPGQLILPEDFSPIQLQLENTPRGILYRLQNSEGRRLAFDPRSGAVANLLQESELKALVEVQEEAAVIERTALLEVAPEEYRGPVPIYQLHLADGRDTRLYVDPWTGKVLARRNLYWRVYDFLWMLHILDFKERENFNNLALKLLSLGALSIIVSGYFLFAAGRMPPRKT